MNDAPDDIDWDESHAGNLAAALSAAEAVIAWDEEQRTIATNVALEDIGADFAKLADTFADWADQCVEARRELAYAKLDLDTLKARLIAEAKSEPRADGKSRTDKDALAYVDTDERWHAAKRLVIEHEVAVGKLQGTLEALRFKRDALVQISAMRRVELQNLG